MRNIFLNLGALMAAKWLAEKRKQQTPKNTDQVLKSRRMEDEVYRQQRRQNDTLDSIRQSCQPQLPVVENLSKDVFQSLYSLIAT